jgi:hypothetical protein
LRHITTRFTVSTRRIEFERGIVSKDVDSLELWRVLDVRYHQTLLDRVFNNGKIVLVSTDRSHPEFVLHGLPNHRALFERLRDSVHVARQSGRPLEIAGDDEIV